MHHQADHQPERVGDDVPLPPLDLLAGIEAANPAALGGFHALAVDDPRRRARLPTLQLARRHDQMVADRPPQAGVAPVVEVALHRRGRRQVLRQHAPLAAGRRDIEDRVHHLPQVRRPGTTDPAAAKARRARPAPIPDPSGRLHTAAPAAHSRAGRYHSRASCLRQSIQTDVNHNPLISLNEPHG